MLQLFLSHPGDDTGNDEAYKKRKSLLDELELVVWSFITQGRRSEARLWLCKTLSGICSIAPRHQRDLFVTLLRSKPIKRHLASQVLQLILEKQAHKVGPIIAKRSKKLEKFFKGNPNRILQWFSNFSGTGDLEHGKGAKSLSQFAFVNRDLCWEELEWKGKHGQSPAMVATKPHYFLDLDVQRTVENFLEYVPEFWSSHEFSESLNDGSICFIDTEFFVNLLLDLMYKEGMEDIWDVVEEFLMEQSFSFLSDHLLFFLAEEDFHIFLDLLPKYLKPRTEFSAFGNASEWFEVILSKYSSSSNIDQLLLLNAVTNQGRQLLRLVHEEGSEEEKEKIKNLVSKLCELSNSDNDLAPIMKESLKTEQLELIRSMGVQCWAIHFMLSEEFHTPESWESLFISNGIKFRKSDRYALLIDKDFSEDCDERASVSLKLKKHKKQRKKRRRNFDSAESREHDLVDLDIGNDKLDLQSKASDWLLSTDDYSATWSSVDLPEYVSKHCFLTWLKWVFAKSRAVA